MHCVAISERLGCRFTHSERKRVHPGFARTICRPGYVRQAHALSRQNRLLMRSGIGKDVVGSWLDLAKLVSSSGSEQKSAFGELAENIGRDVYVDINGWHLYLRDIRVADNLKMHQALADQLGPQLAKGDFDDLRIEQFLRQVPVNLGGGKLKVRLTDALPSFAMQDFMKICKEYADNY